MDGLGCALLLALVEAVVVPVGPARLRRARGPFHRPAARQPVVRRVVSLGLELGLGLGPATLVASEPALDLFEDLVLDEAEHTVLDEVLAKGVVADVCAVLEELVEVLGREPVPERRADPGSIEPVGDLLHGVSVGVGVEDLGDDRGCLGARDVALVAVHGEAEDLVAVAQGSLGVVVLASSDVG